MWHASGRSIGGQSSAQIARNALRGVGDATLGEWLESGSRGIVHVRRRLSLGEQETFGIPFVRDIRGSDEERDRLVALFAEAPQLRAAFGL